MPQPPFTAPLPAAPQAAGRFSFDPPAIEVGPDGRPRPLDPATGKPVMTPVEANWHAHLAGVATSTATRRDGEPFLPVATAAAAAAAAPQVAGRPLQPFSMGHFLVLELLGTAYTSPNPEGTPKAVSMPELVRVTWALLHPEEALLLLEAGSLADLDKQARAFAFQVTGEEFRRVNEWVNREMAVMQGGTAAEAKKPSTAGAAPPPGAAPAATSPPWSGPANPPPAGG